MRLQGEEYDKIIALKQIYEDLGDVYYDVWHQNLIDEEVKKTEALVAATKLQVEWMEKMKKLWGYSTDDIAFSKIYNTMPSSFAEAVKPKHTLIGGGMARGGVDLAGAPDTMENINKMTEGLYKQWEMVNDLQRAFEALFANTQNGFKGMAQAFGNALRLMMAELAGKALLFGILQLLTGGTGKIFAGITGGKSFWKFLGFANGTNSAPGGLSLVGESGPELVNLPRRAQVIPNHVLSSLAGNQGGRVVFEIEDTKLVGILEKYSRKVNSYS